jgi:dermatan/chondrotin sulfate uronyl 2-O-sulfotransferase UST
LRELASKRKFTLHSKEIFVPFLLSTSVQQEVMYELDSAQLPVLYERHMYFIDANYFQKPQPVYINIVREPLQQTISAYYYSREACIIEKRCYFDTQFLNETLDECLQLRSAEQCIDAAQGTSPMLPFFCGNEIECELNKTYALQKAKENIVKHYTVVGIVEELYNFFFVLENLLPRYFANVCLLYLSNGMSRMENMRTLKISRDLSAKGEAALRLALSKEYELYHFIKEHFHTQLYTVLQTLIK